MIRDEGSARWKLTDRDGAAHAVRVSGDRVSDVVRRRAMASAGIAYESWLDVADDVAAGRLRIICQEWIGEAAPLSLICPDRRVLGPSVQKLRTFLQSCCEKLPPTRAPRESFLRRDRGFAILGRKSPRWIMGSTTSTPRRILIVCAIPGVAHDLEDRLVRLGFVVVGVAASGAQALVLGDLERAAVALVDARPAGLLDGAAIAAQLRDKLAMASAFLASPDACDAAVHANASDCVAAHTTDGHALALDDRELRLVLELALHKHAAERERRSLEDQLRRSEKMDAIGQLASGVAHDFNNVLMAILSNCRTLIAELPADQRPRQRVAMIQIAAERAAGLTRQLLAFGRDELAPPRALDLGAHIYRTSNMLMQLLSDNISVAISLAPGLRAVLGRSSEIEQVIMNLVVNARDAMPRGGAVTIGARNVPDANEVLLTVTDTGEGMDDDTRRRIFEPFFTTKQVGAGTGLGLATVYAVVARAHGRIEVASEPGKGTTFAIWLPATHEVPHEASDLLEPIAPAAAELGDGPLPALRGTVVVVEDDPQVRDAICGILRDTGLDVLEASDGADALRACRAHRGAIDVVLSDVVLPQLSGPELARALVADHPRVRFLYMSGYPQRRLPGGHELERVLQKPFTPNQLLYWIRDALPAAT